jgi:hypothetical protein
MTERILVRLPPTTIQHQSRPLYVTSIVNTLRIPIFFGLCIFLLNRKWVDVTSPPVRQSCLSLNRCTDHNYKVTSFTTYLTRHDGRLDLRATDARGKTRTLFDWLWAHEHTIHHPCQNWHFLVSPLLVGIPRSFLRKSANAQKNAIASAHILLSTSSIHWMLSNSNWNRQELWHAQPQI